MNRGYICLVMLAVALLSANAEREDLWNHEAVVEETSSETAPVTMLVDTSMGTETAAEKLWRLGEDPDSAASPTFKDHLAGIQMLNHKAREALTEDTSEQAEHMDPMWEKIAQADSAVRKRADATKERMHKSLGMDNRRHDDEMEDDEELLQTSSKLSSGRLADIRNTVRADFIAAGLLEVPPEKVPAPTSKPKVVITNTKPAPSAKPGGKSTLANPKPTKKGPPRAKKVPTTVKKTAPVVKTVAKQAPKTAVKAVSKEGMEVKQLKAKLQFVKKRDAAAKAAAAKAAATARSTKVIKAKMQKVVVTKDHVHVPTKGQLKTTIKEERPPSLHTDPLYWRLKKLRQKYHLSKNYQALKRQLLKKYLARHYASRLVKDRMRRTVNRLRRERALQQYGPGAHYKPFTWGEYEDPKDNNQDNNQGQVTATENQENAIAEDKATDKAEDADVEANQGAK